MSLCCIGGVCVPTSAVIPLLILALKWVLDQMVKFGLLPSFLQRFLSKTGESSSSTQVAPRRRGKLSSLTSSTDVSKATDETLPELLQKNEKVIVKFSGSCCKPCKTIRPFYHSLSSLNAQLVEMDIDESEASATKYGVTVLPTFLAFHRGEMVDKYAGSSKELLESFVKKTSEL